MGVSWAMLAPFIAIAITIAAMQAAVVLTGAIRSRDFHRFEDQSRDSLARQFRLPTVDPSAAEERRKSLSPFSIRLVSFRTNSWDRANQIQVCARVRRTRSWQQPIRN
jgi:hypothetical protein